jgi:hypothetical protein
VPILGRRR